MNFEDIIELTEQVSAGKWDGDLSHIIDHTTPLIESLKSRQEILLHQLMRLHVGDRVIIDCPEFGIHETAMITKIQLKKIVVDLDKQNGKWCKGVIVPMQFVKIY